MRPVGRYVGHESSTLIKRWITHSVSYHDCVLVIKELLLRWSHFVVYLYFDPIQNYQEAGSLGMHMGIIFTVVIDMGRLIFVVVRRSKLGTSTHTLLIVIFDYVSHVIVCFNLLVLWLLHHDGLWLWTKINPVSLKLLSSGGYHGGRERNGDTLLPSVML